MGTPGVFFQEPKTRTSSRCRTTQSFYRSFCPISLKSTRSGRIVSAFDRSRASDAPSKRVQKHHIKRHLFVGMGWLSRSPIG